MIVYRKRGGDGLWRMQLVVLSRSINQVSMRIEEFRTEPDGISCLPS